MKAWKEAAEKKTYGNAVELRTIESGEGEAYQIKPKLYPYGVGPEVMKRNVEAARIFIDNPDLLDKLKDKGAVEKISKGDIMTVLSTDEIKAVYSTINRSKEMPADTVRLILKSGIHQHNLTGSWKTGIEDELIDELLELAPYAAVEMVGIINKFNSPLAKKSE